MTDMTLQTDYPGMDVAEYCKVNGRGSVAKLARLTGTNWRTIHNIQSGKSLPTPRIAVAIEYATEGAVRSEKILGIGTLRRQAERVYSKLKAAEAFLKDE